MDYDADIWRALRRKLEQGLVALRLQQKTTRAEPKEEQSVESLYQKFAQLDEASSREVDKAIKSWCVCRFARWPRLSVDGQAMLQVRLETAAELLELLITRDAKASDDLALGAGLAMGDAARRVLIGWWNARGRGLGCERWVVGRMESGG